MKKIAIFLLQNPSEYYPKLIHTLDEQGYEIHLTENIKEIYPEYACEYLLQQMEDGSEISEVILISDIRDVITFSYRMFNLCFSKFIWIPRKEDSISFTEIYKEISDFNQMKEDFVKGKIELYLSEGLSKELLKFLIMNKRYEYFKLWHLEDEPEKEQGSLEFNYLYKKEYIFKERYYSIGRSKHKRKIVLDTTSELSEFVLEESLLEFLIKNPLLLSSVLEHQIFVGLEDDLFGEVEIYKQLKLNRKDIYGFLAFMDGYSDTKYQETKVYLYSLLLKRYRQQEDFKNFIDFLIRSSIDFYKIKFIYSQLIYFVFSLNDTMDNQILAKLHLLYRHLVRLAQRLFQEEIALLDKAKGKKKGNIVIFCGQFLEENHAPTRRVMDYTIAYMKRLYKNILIINSADMNRYLEMNYEGGVCANYLESYDSQELRKVMIRDQEVSFYQIHNAYEDQSEIRYVFEQINEFAPEYILTVGDSNVLADLCSIAVPVANLPCGTGLTVTEGNYYILLREMQRSDEDLLNRIGRKKEDLVESVYTFRKPLMQRSQKKTDFGIDENEFCVCIVGNRLDKELDTEMVSFLQTMIERLEIRVVMIGHFNNYDAFIHSWKGAKERVVYIGYQKDIMGVYEAFDVCFNPKRKGGGSSVAQAMLAGLPVISSKIGDGAYALGMDLCFDSEEQMIGEVEKLKDDRAYYIKQSNVMKERAKSLFDTETMIKELDENILRRIRV